MRGFLAAMVAPLAVAGACAAQPGAGSADPGAPERLRVRVVAEYPHDPEAFTQGLVWHDGRLYESAGGYGTSSLRRVVLESGSIERRVELPAELFGEGLERVGDRLVQLTWREQTARVYELASLELVAELAYIGEGWGLCFDGVDLVRSDGSDTLFFHDAGSMAQLRTLSVSWGLRRVPYLNELECTDGEIYANVWQTDSIVRIDPASGSITAIVDASSLRAAELGTAAGVLNGIAYRPETATFLVTGKNWAKLYEVDFVADQLGGDGR